jgi:hypothetical protein
MNKRRQKKALSKFANGGRLTESEKRYLSKRYGFKVVMALPDFSRGIYSLSRIAMTAIHEYGERVRAAVQKVAFKDWFKEYNLRMYGECFTDQAGNIIPLDRVQWINPSPGQIDPMAAVKAELKKVEDYKAAERKSDEINLMAGLFTFPVATAAATQPRSPEEVISDLRAFYENARPIVAEAMEIPVRLVGFEGKHYAICKDAKTAKKFEDEHINSVLTAGADVQKNGTTLSIEEWANHKREIDPDKETPAAIITDHMGISEGAADQVKKDRKAIAFSCGFCGAPLNMYKDQVDAPEGYDPNNYPHDACGRCQAERAEPRYVTREMAIDAGDPSLEGSIW